MKKIIVFLVIVVLLGCEDEIKMATSQSNSSVEIAFPSMKGELISLKGSGENQIVIEKKADQYVFMGDIILTEKQVALLRKDGSNQRTALEDINTLWPSATVFYKINSSLPNQARVTDAINHWQTVAPYMRFIVRTTQPNYIEFVSGEGCSSNLGMIGGRQTITLSNDCTMGNTIHEIGHAVGLLHEHTRADRNNFIIVNFNNIQSNRVSQFNTYATEGIDGFETGTLDFGSIMLYPSFNNFAIDPALPTMTRLDGTAFPAQRVALSAGDLEIIQILHGPPFARIESEVVEEYNSGGMEYRIEAFYISFFQNRNLTVPFTLTNQTRINYTSQETHYNQSPAYWNTTAYSYVIQPGSNRYWLGEFTTHSCEYDYSGSAVGDCFTTSVWARDGHRYNN